MLADDSYRLLQAVEACPRFSAVGDAKHVAGFRRAMKSLSDGAFFRVFDEVLRRHAGGDRGAWSNAGTTWRRERHAFQSEGYGFALELYEGRHGEDWAILVVKEHWWIGRGGDVLRSSQWTKLLHGKRAAALAWFAKRKKDYEAS